MTGERLRRGGLLALLCALLLALGAAPSLGQEDQEAEEEDVSRTRPLPGRQTFPHKAPGVTIWFNKPIVQNDPERPVTIRVTDECDRMLHSKSGVEQPKPKYAKIKLDRRKTNPNGFYYVTAEYWLESDEEENNDDPEGGDDPPAAQARTYSYKFKVHGGPNCDGSGGGGNHPPGHGNGGGSGDKKRVWGSTSGDHHDPDGGHSGHENLRTAGSTSSTHDDHNSSDYDPFDPYTSPTIPSSDDHTNHNSSSTTPFDEDDFGEPFGESTGNSPISNPDDPSLYSTDSGQIPEEAEDQQTLSATPIDDLGPESGTLVVALAAALLLGVGGGLFLRRTDPAPIRPRS